MPPGRYSICHIASDVGVNRKTLENPRWKIFKIFGDTLLSEQRLQMESLWIEYLVEIQLSKEGLGFHRKCFQFSIYTQHCLQFPQNAVPSPKEGLPCQKILLWRRGALLSPAQNIFKHRKNCECCPGHSLTISHLASMSWFLNLSGIVSQSQLILCSCW